MLLKCIGEGLKRDTRVVVAMWICSNGSGYYAPGTKRTLDMENGESLNLVPRSINS